MRCLSLLVLVAIACGPKDPPIDTDNTSTDTTNSTDSAGSATVVMTAGETCNSGTVGCTDDSLTEECGDSSATCTLPPTSEDPSITGCIVHTVGCTSIDPTTAAPDTDVTATDTDTDADTGTGTETDTDGETFNPCAVETAGCTGFGTTGTGTGTTGAETG